MKRSPIKRIPMKRTAKKRASQEIRQHWDKVASLGCIVTGAQTNVTIHHVHGGSVRGIIPRGMGMKLDWLVIPLHASLHTGRKGIDTGHWSVEEWEAQYGTQWDMLLAVMRATGVDVMAKSGLAWPEGVDKPAQLCNTTP